MTTFEIGKNKKGDGRTFSPEATWMFLETVFDYINKVMTNAIKQGFEKKQPVESIRMTISWTVDGKPFDEKEVLATYPQCASFSLEALAEHIKRKTQDMR